MKRLCTICARGGSKGVRHKNLRVLLGKPLIAYTIEQARRSGLFNCIAVSSDSQNILLTGAEYGADLQVLRPASLADDHAPKLAAIRHCLVEAERRSGMTFDTIVDLDVTAPLRVIADIEGAIALLESTNAGNVLSASPARRSPYFNMVEHDQRGQLQLVKPPTVPLFRRQDAPDCFDLNAAVYAWRREWLLSGKVLIGPRSRLYVMPAERSLDIDSESDLEQVAYLLARRQEGEEHARSTCSEPV